MLDAIPLPQSNGLAALALAGYGIVVAVLVNVLNQLIVPRSKTLPPLVFHWFPIIGSAVTYGMDPYKFLFECREKHGDVFTFVLLGRKVTVALGTQGNNFILNGKLAQVNAEAAYTNLTTPVFGTGVVYDCPNSMLMEQKKFVKSGLTTENFQAYVPIIVKEVTDYFDAHVFGRNKAKAAVSPPLDALDTASEITICTASATLQGPEVREALDTTYAQVYHDLDGGFTPLNFIFTNLPLPSFRKRDIAQKKMSDLYRSIMERRRKEGREENDMLQALQGQAYRDGRELNDVEISHIMIALLMAGQHTSAATGSWLMLHLADKPELQQALYEEQVQQHGEADGTFKPLAFESLQTPLLAGHIREVLRLHPPLHSLMRLVISDMPVPATLSAPQHGHENDIYIIPKGHYVLAAPGVSHIDPLIWSRANEFDPNRWLTGEVADKMEKEGGETVDYGWGAISKSASSPYLPFGSGRHRCIGEHFANVQLGTLLATIIREYTWKLDGPMPAQDYTTMIVSPTKPRNLIFSRRK